MDDQHFNEIMNLKKYLAKCSEVRLENSQLRNENLELKERLKVNGETKELLKEELKKKDN